MENKDPKEDFAREFEESQPEAQGSVGSKPHLEEAQKPALLEALLFACGEPLGKDTIQMVTGLSEEEVTDVIESLRDKLKADESGLELVTVASKFQLRTKAVFAPYLRELKSGGPRKLTAAALETLSIVAYRQPIVKSDIEKIRGVDATPTLKTLIDRNLVRILGHQATVGQPALYATTDEFLSVFGLNSISDLPTLREISEIERDPGETQSDQQDEIAPSPLEAAQQ